MDRKKIIALLVITNLILILCLIFFVVSIRTGDIEAPVVSIDVMGTESNDVNSQPPTGKTTAKPEDILACFDSGKEQRYLKAIEDYGQVMRSEPPYLGVLTEVQRYARNGQWEKAQAICTHHIQYNEDKREGYYSLAWIRAKQGANEDAIQILDELIHNYPEFVKSYVTLGWIHAKEGRYDEAVSVCRNVVKMSPQTETGHYWLGRLYALLDNPAEAIASYSEAIRIKPDFAEAHLFLGLSYCQQDKWAEGLKALGDAISLDRQYEQAHLFRAVAYNELGLYKEASESLEDAIRLGQFGSSSKQRWSVFGIDPDYARLHCALAGIYARLGEYHKAVLTCKDAIAIAPASPEGYYYIALAYLLLGDTDQALQQRDKLKSLQANDMAARLDGLLNK